MGATLKLWFGLAIAVWFATGLINLLVCKEISKFQYGMLWTTSIAYMIILLCKI